MKRLSWLIAPFAFSLIFGLAACGDDGGGDDDMADASGGGADGNTLDAPPAQAFTLTFTSSAYNGPHNGQDMHFALWDNADTSAAVLTDMATVPNGQQELQMTWTDAILEGHSYELHYHADVNDNGSCDGPALDMDHAWSIAIDNVSAAVNLNPTEHSTDFNGDCAKL